ncbi:hypothetical protein [Cupriavidus sp. CuC1]|uniref:hypothetical protein n=1 Tax=Cupriavidus sp. CuC1 TaxID=3373131 RepID=UPI0037D6A42D
MSHYIEADFTTLMDQASSTAASYLYEAKQDIDKHLGDGYAAKNPALVHAAAARRPGPCLALRGDVDPVAC